MKLVDIYKTAVDFGIKNDPRGAKGVKEFLERSKKEHEALSGWEKKYYDKERLENPFSDTRILYGNPDTEVKVVAAGVDMEGPELLLLDRLREKGKRVDLCIAHHPEGRALAALADVMGLQADVWAKFGVPVNIGDALISERMAEIRRAFMPQNHQRPVQMARLLDLPYMCIHTPADNLVYSYLTKLLGKEKSKTLADVIELLLSEDEYRLAASLGMGPAITVGKKNSRAGTVMVDMTGGTEGPEAMVEKLAQAGVGTLVCMHMSDKARKEAEKQHVNVVVAGHIASDSIGINLFLDQLEKKGVKAFTISGVERFCRIKKPAKSSS